MQLKFRDRLITQLRCNKFMKFNDVSGVKFGKLTAVEIVGKAKNQANIWSCKCDCGNTVEIPIGNLTSGNSTSCGCVDSPNLCGLRVGKLTVIKECGRSNSGSVLYLCKCDCGNESSVRAGRLRSGETKSCGCYNRLDLTGKKFGLLTALRVEIKSGKGGVRWVCKCDCGNEVSIPSTRLTSGRKKNCGCTKQKHNITETDRKRRADAARKLFTTHGMSQTKEYIQVAHNKRNSKKRLLDSEWTVEMQIALEEMFPECVVCGDSSNLATDHVLPLSKGNGLNPGNAVRLCRKCNSRKKDRSLDYLGDNDKAKVEESANKFKIYWESRSVN